MTAPTWSPQQAVALEKVAAWFKDPAAPQIFRLFGYAGTGKTTLAMHLAEHARQAMFAAFTGKAASVLREKGCPGASTLHALLYNVRDRDKAKLYALKEAMNALTPGHPDYPEAKAEYDLEVDKAKRPWFHVNPDSDLKWADLLVVDEVSMVDERIGKDIESFGKKVLVLGDPAQLPPVKGGGYFTSAKPDVLLTEIHRQAADNPILRWATMARKGEIIPMENLGNAWKLRRGAVDDAWLATAGQILCGKNATRQELNHRVRKQMGRTSEFPVAKDRLVMLMNEHKIGVLNGTICWAYTDAELDPADPTMLWMNIKYPDEGTSHFKLLQSLRVDAGPFRSRPVQEGRSRLQVDFGYALTVHKAQGSQWDSVVIYDDGFGKLDPDVRRRWLYTAITRAAKQLYILTT